MGNISHPRPHTNKGEAFALDKTFIVLEEVSARVPLLVIQRLTLKDASDVVHKLRLPLACNIDKGRPNGR